MRIGEFASRKSLSSNVPAVTPGILLSCVLAGIAVLCSPLVALVFPMPTMVLALILGIVLNPVAGRAIFAPGLTFCVKKLLRWSVGLLGVRVTASVII